MKKYKAAFIFTAAILIAAATAQSASALNTYTWSQLPTSLVNPGTTDLRGIWGTADNGSALPHIFVVGAAGKIFHRDSLGCWVQEATGETRDLNGVYGWGPTSVIAVADYKRTMYYYTGSWAKRSSDNLDDGLYSVWGPSPTNAFAAGKLRDFLLYQYNFQYININNSANIGTSTPSANVAANRYGVWGTSATNVFLVGDQASNGSKTNIQYYNGSWSQISSGYNSTTLYGIWGCVDNGSTNIYAVGASGTILKSTNNGSSWTKMTTPVTSTLRSINGTGASNIVAVGDGGVILHYNGTAWTQLTSGTTVALKGVWSSTSGDVYAVGSNGTILHGTKVMYSTWYRDADGDGYGNASVTTQALTQPAGYVADSTDCNDSNASVHPNAPEICDGIDNNCNGRIDEGFGLGAECEVGVGACYREGVMVCSGGVAVCNAVAGTPTPEVCDGIDNNCDGQIDEGVKTTYYRDGDGDGYGNAAITTQACSAPAGFVANSLDCDDNNTSVHPGATEILDGIDNNCNGQIDEGFYTTTILPVSSTTTIQKSSTTTVSPISSTTTTDNSSSTTTTAVTSSSTTTIQKSSTTTILPVTTTTVSPISSTTTTDNSSSTTTTAVTSSSTTTIQKSSTTTILPVTTTTVSPISSTTTTDNSSSTTTTAVTSSSTTTIQKSSTTTILPVTTTVSPISSTTTTDNSSSTTTTAVTSSIITTTIQPVSSTTTTSTNFLQRKLTVAKSGAGDGRVTGTGISCGSDCTEFYDNGTVVTLTEVADTQSTFVSWTGCDNDNATTTGTCRKKVATDNQTVTAAFSFTPRSTTSTTTAWCTCTTTVPLTTTTTLPLLTTTTIPPQSSTTTTIPTTTTTVAPVGVFKDDFNGDTNSDILLKNAAGSLYVLAGKVDGVAYGVPARIYKESTPATYTVVGTGDFNGDQNVDILLKNAAGSLYVLFGKDDGVSYATTATRIYKESTPATYTVVGTGDFNNDTYCDILLKNAAGSLYVLFGKADGVAYGVPARIYKETSPATYTVTGTGDFNGDGNCDILLNNANGSLYVLFGKDDGVSYATTATRIYKETTPATYSVVGTGDFNGDGNDDVLLKNAAGSLYVLFGKDDGMAYATTATRIYKETSPATYTPVLTGDYNGDGNTDVLLQNANGSLYVLFGKDDGVAYATTATRIYKETSPATYSVVGY